ncbi:mRpL3 [Drosophila busckii]|uniref:Large ribosomal subunit protein uL3m n=1 Tax=Drosophila busckii TaxID=30019 RepID=A0A0M4EVM1_DROBS|nr:39S ribosomal protein L3, mitochondrial [Drosophila busckii]ALC49347.1 mRpL3 [Drosophila busckii]
MLRTVIGDLARLRLSNSASPSIVLVTQVREKGHLSRPRQKNPYWFVRQQRTQTEDLVTGENRNFINEVVHDTYGAPAIIKGIQTYEQKQLVKTPAPPNTDEQLWTPGLRRSGLIARKIGQYPLWLKNGERVRTTLLQVVDNHVIKYIPPEEYKPSQRPHVHNLNKYGCLLVGAESTNPALLTKEYCGIFRDSGVMPTKSLARFIVSPQAALAAGTPLNVGHFRVGDFVDVRGKTVDHGFQGVVKRHGFKGMPASHGVTKTHRRAGNIGGGGEKGRVWPGTKMPGHMGNRWRILKGLRIWRINTKYNVMWVQGSSVPGSTNGLVYIYDTILPLRKSKDAPPFPTLYEQPDAENAPEDIWYDQVHNFKDETITYKPE